MNLAVPLLFWLCCVAGSAWIARSHGKPGLPWAALAGWLALAPYNAWIKHGCPGDCGIRVDVLIVGPALLAVTIAAILGWATKRMKARQASKARGSHRS